MDGLRNEGFITKQEYPKEMDDPEEKTQRDG